MCPYVLNALKQCLCTYPLHELNPMLTIVVLQAALSDMDWFSGIQKGLAAAQIAAVEVAAQATEKAKILAAQASEQAKVYAEQAAEQAKASVYPCFPLLPKLQHL